jgi:hypothetical protein
MGIGVYACFEIDKTEICERKTTPGRNGWMLPARYYGNG